MAGYITNGVPNGTIFTGLEQSSFDTQAANGSNPQTESINVVQLGRLISYYNQVADKTVTAGSRYYTSINLGNPATITGIQVLVGTTGGTDLWIAELHSPTGALLATTTLSGTTAGTASTWQQIAFTAPYTLTQSGTYYIAIQSNGNTAKLATLNSATSPLYTGSATGVFATSASITPPTTYTANLGPQAYCY